MDELKKHPERFYGYDYKKDVENNKDYYKLPFKMSEVEKDLYYRFKFAEKQYLELVNYLNNTLLENPDAGTEQEKRFTGIGKTPEGLAKNMDTEAFELLQEKTAALISTGSMLGSKLSEGLKKDVTKDEAESNSPRQQRGSLLYDISLSVKRASRDAGCIQMVDPENLPSYKTMHSQTTDIIIDTEGKTLDSKGNALSSRVPIRYIDENGNLRQGFFTRNINSGKTKLEVFQEAEKDFNSKALKDLYEKLKEKENYKHLAEYETDDTGRESKATVEEFFLTVQLSEAAELAGKLSEDEAKKVMELQRAMCKQDVAEALNRKYGIEPGRNVNTRNTSMSDMATLLDMGHIVAKSVPMTIIENGEPVSGNFMENATGLGGDEIRAITPELKGEEFTVNYNRVMRDSLDMMVLDYICLNVDRHSGNQFYRFEEKEGKMALCGIQGIDNDLSFGNIVPDSGKHLKYLPPLNAIKHMTEKTRNAVMKLNRSNVVAALGNGTLSEDEVEACWTRVEKLQQRIKEGNIVICDEKKIFTSAEFEAYEKERKNYGKNGYTTPFSNIIGLQEHYNRSRQEKYFTSQRIDNMADDAFAEVRDIYNEQAELVVKEGDPFGKIKLNFYKEMNSAREKAEKVYRAHKDKHGIKETDQEEKKTISDKIRPSIQRIENKYKQAFKEAAQKIVNKEIRVLEEKRKKEEQIKKGVANLSSRLHIRGDMTFKVQKDNIKNLCNKLWKPKGDDIPEYGIMYGEMQKLKELMDHIAKNEIPGRSHPSLISAKGELTDFAENILEEQYKSVQKAVQDYGRRIYSDLTRNNVKRVIISEAVRSVCEIGIEQRERKVNEINETMAATVRALAEAQKKTEEAKNNYDLAVKGNDLRIKEKKTEYDWTKRQVDEKALLASFVGALELPGDVTRDKIDKTLGVLAYAEMLEGLKKKDPESYKMEMKAMENDPAYVDSRVEGLLENEHFKKIVGNVNPFTALRVNAPKAIAAEADKFGMEFFKTAAPEVKKQSSLQGP